MNTWAVLTKGIPLVCDLLLKVISAWEIILARYLITDDEWALFEGFIRAGEGDPRPSSCGGRSSIEPHRVYRRLQLLSRMEHHEQDNEQVFP